MKKPRLFYLDLIRAVALVCILIIHFNASVTGYFTYPSRLFGSILPGGIYLGDFGSSLFFMVSGAALLYTAKDPFAVRAFYRKRAAAVYPMFWLAWLICFPIRFLTKPGLYAGAHTITLVLTVLGLDNFAVAGGWISQDFACVGEWFLGSILFLYLVFPFLKKGLAHRPALTWAAALAVCLPVHLLGWDGHLLGVHLLEFLFGMTFVRLRRIRPWLALAILAWPALLPLKGILDAKLLCALVSAAVFIALCGISGRLENAATRSVCRLLTKYAYAVFLVHHVLILKMVEGFDLSVLSRRDTVLLFGIYLLAVAAASWALFRLDGAVRRGIGDFAKILRPQAEPPARS